MEGTFRLRVAGLIRELKLMPISETVSIPAFIMFSDLELTIACAGELLKKVPEFDIILTAEAKGIPLAYEMARQSGKNYVLARKGMKLYMEDPIVVEVTSITTAAPQKLYLDAKDQQRLKGKRVLIVDDVISTGRSLKGLQELASRSGGVIAANAAALAEGDSIGRTDIIALGELPLFQTN